MGTSEPPFSLDGVRARRLKAMLAEHFDFVWRSLRRMGVPAADVDDAAQNVFLVAARRLDQIMSDRDRAFLFATAVRVASTFRRAVRRHPEEPSLELEQVQSSALSPEDLSELSRARPLLQGILEEMSLEQRSVFILCELEELESQEVADLLDVPLGTVYSRLRGAREIFQSAARRLSARDSFRRKAKP
jgi:RNA polymerase sigma-70 factor (ECF subfamily)